MGGWGEVKALLRLANFTLGPDVTLNTENINIRFDKFRDIHVRLGIHRFKSKKGASVSEDMALFNWSSVGYMRSTIWSK